MKTHIFRAMVIGCAAACCCIDPQQIQQGGDGEHVQQQAAVNLSPVIGRIDALETHLTARVDATAVRLERNQTASAGRDVKSNSGWLIFGLGALIVLAATWDHILAALGRWKKAG